ncbi:PLDc N-terminal domain-containing protein [Arthrobacter sp. M4]|nr:PLDc N-terminal domain-containing protein [Arthrobacter sp. M4]
MNGTFASSLPWIILVAALGVWAYALLDFTATDARDVRTFSRTAWAVILVFGSVLGAVAWLVAGGPPRSPEPRSPEPRSGLALRRRRCGVRRPGKAC